MLAEDRPRAFKGVGHGLIFTFDATVRGQIIAESVYEIFMNFLGEFYGRLFPISGGWRVLPAENSRFA